jgi:hypothetical protein
MTTITISQKTKEDLQSLGNKGETYEEIVSKIVRKFNSVENHD